MSNTAVIVVVGEDHNHEDQHEDNLVSEDCVGDAVQLSDQRVLDQVRHRSILQDLVDFHSRGSVALSLNRTILIYADTAASTHGKLLLI